MRAPPLLPAAGRSALVLALLTTGGGIWAGAATASGKRPTGPCTDISPPPSPGGLNVPYKQVPGGDLVLDVYEPSGPGPFPALVVVHGGGYRSGCKGKVAPEAKLVSDGGFVAFNISYRLSCDPADPPPDVQDPAVECAGPGVGAESYGDVQDAVGWVRDNAASYDVLPSQVAALGFSSGGLLVLMAAATAGAGAAPQVVASWSGGSELGFLTDGVTPACTRSPDHGCMAKRESFVGCPLTGEDACPEAWYALSPYTVYPADGPPAFIANATEEVIPFVEARDLDRRLAALGVDHRLCTVKGPFHATGYRDLPCARAGSATVFERTIAFVSDRLGA